MILSSQKIIKNKTKLIRSILFASYIVCIAIIAALVSKYCFQLILVQGRSMEPTYHNMQLVMIKKGSDDVAEGDIIAFECVSLNSVLIKRVVAIPGQVVVIQNGTLYVDGRGNHFYEDKRFSYAGLFGDEVRLSKDEYAVIGDNIDKSIDSRYSEVGLISSNAIIGKIIHFNSCSFSKSIF